MDFTSLYNTPLVEAYKIRMIVIQQLRECLV